MGDLKCCSVVRVKCIMTASTTVLHMHCDRNTVFKNVKYFHTVLAKII